MESTDLKLDTFQVFLIIIVPALIAIIPKLIEVYQTRKTKRKQVSEAVVDETTAADKVSTAYDRLVEDLQIRIDKMENRQNATDAKVSRQGKRIRHLEQGVIQLIDQVKSLGAEPVFTITNEEIEEDKNL